MSNTQVVRKIVAKLAEELKSSNMHSSDADWYIGFGDDNNTANEAANEYDPKTGKIAKNNTVGDHTTYLQQWDADNTGYLESEDVKRDSGGGIARIVMQQITPIK